MDVKPGRLVCAQCSRPLSTCYCELLKPVFNQLPLLVFQHQSETKHAFNTVALLEQSLQSIQKMIVQNDQVICEEQLGSSLLQSNSQSNNQSNRRLSSSPLLLYPNESSVPIDEVDVSSVNTLIVLDGTWRKVYKMWKESAWLQSLPSCHLPENPTNRYLVRHSKRKDSYSTLEATLVCLKELENTKVEYQSIFDAFDWLMKRQQGIKNRFMTD